MGWPRSQGSVYYNTVLCITQPWPELVHFRRPVLGRPSTIYSRPTSSHFSAVPREQPFRVSKARGNGEQTFRPPLPMSTRGVARSSKNLQNPINVRSPHPNPLRRLRARPNVRRTTRCCGRHDHCLPALRLGTFRDSHIHELNLTIQRRHQLNGLRPAHGHGR